MIWLLAYVAVGFVWAGWLAYANRKECGGGVELDKAVLIIALWPLIFAAAGAVTFGEMWADYEVKAKRKASQ